MKRIPLMYIALILAGSVHAQEATQPTKHKIGVSQYELPKYPPIARAARVQGEVRLALSFLGDGSFEKVEVVSGPPMLRQAAIDMVQKWRFVCMDCSYGESFQHSVIVMFGFLNPKECDHGGTRYKLEFPDRVELTTSAMCVQTVSSF
ncbi:MAG: energy transducer TonB [Acidobacteriales bacterium]|nr:energy transducer TonB [Terriglobales bacterium]